MKRNYLFALFFGMALSLSAQSSLDLQSRVQLRQQRLVLKQSEKGVDKNLNLLKSRMPVSPSRTMGMIKLAPGASVEDLEAEGVEVLRSRYGFAFVSLPVSDVERVASLKSVQRFQLARPVAAKMDKARKATGVDKIHQGLGLPQAYTGKGVVCGIVDNGIEPNHINFLDEDGKSRVGFLAHITANQSTGELTEKFYGRGVTANVKDIATFTTDDNTTYHGSHTMGTMAGSYKGNAMVASTDGLGTATVAEQANPFYGVAYDADIAVGCGDLYDMVIAFGVDYIVQYAEYEKKPVVVNLSLGSNTGAHDGKGVINQFFDITAKETNAIICVASGNEGDMKIALNKTFTETDKEAKTFIVGQEMDGNGYMRYGNVEIYSDDDTPLDIQAVIFNKKRGRIAQRFPLTVDENTQGYGQYWVSSDEYNQGEDIVDAQFANYFQGYVGMGWNVDPDNNRFYTILDYYAINDAVKNADGNYVLGFVINGKPGQRVDVFCDGTFSTLSDYEVAGWDDGMLNGSISDMATGNSTLVVGSYDTRKQWGALDGYAYQTSYNINDGEISEFSSYGTLVDGRNLPHVCAPGAVILSSLNSYFVKAGNANPTLLTAKADNGDQTNYWGWAVGTSMATPHVAGAIALWLEADPTLTLNEIKDIVASTAIRDEAVLRADPVQAGAGKFDAYAGLQEVIRRATGVGRLEADKAPLLVSAVGERAFRAFLAGASEMEVVLCDLSGKNVLHTSSPGDEVIVDVSSLAKGVYVLRVNETNAQKIVVK